MYLDREAAGAYLDRRENWSCAMYLDREEDIDLSSRPGSRNVANDAVEAKAPVDPEILRRWRHPGTETEPPADEPEAAPRHPLPAVIEGASEESAAPPDDKPAPRRIGRRKLALLGVLLAAAAIGGGWFGYRWWTVGRFMISTDDAYVRADNTTLAAKQLASQQALEQATANRDQAVASVKTA